MRGGSSKFIFWHWHEVWYLLITNCVMKLCFTLQHWLLGLLVKIIITSNHHYFKYKAMEIFLWKAGWFSLNKLSFSNRTGIANDMVMSKLSRFSSSFFFFPAADHNFQIFSDLIPVQTSKLCSYQSMQTYANYKLPWIKANVSSTSI